MKKTSLFIILTSLLIQGVKNEKRCLHQGCPLSNGLKAADLNTTIRNNLKDSESYNHVLRFATWNILHDEEDRGLDSWVDRKEDLCRYLRLMDPTVVGLQEVLHHQLTFIQSRLPDYSFVGVPRTYGQLGHYNPIFFKKDKRVSVIENGTFWLSETPDVPESKLPAATNSRICTWTKIRITTEEYLYKKESSVNKLFRLLKTSTNAEDGTDNNSAESEKKINKRYSFDMYFANTHLNWKNNTVARDQMKILLSHLKDKIMGRRRFPVIMTGDLNWEDNSLLYEEIERFDWMKNTMATARKSYPALTSADFTTLKGKELIDYVWQDKFESIVSATMMDLRPNGKLLSDHRPVVAALISESNATPGVNTTPKSTSNGFLSRVSITVLVYCVVLNYVWITHFI